VWFLHSIPLYGRAFENTTGIQQPYSGVGDGSWDAGVWDVKVLPFPGATVIEDYKTGGAYSHGGRRDIMSQYQTQRADTLVSPLDATKKELITFDTVGIVQQKAKYIMRDGLAGSSYWDLSSDYVGSGSLVAAAVNQYKDGLDQTPNHLYYPGSRFDNIRSCMGACPSNCTNCTTTPNYDHTRGTTIAANIGSQ